MNPQTPYRRVPAAEEPALRRSTEICALDTRDAALFAREHIDGAQPLGSTPLETVLRGTPPSPHQPNDALRAWLIEQGFAADDPAATIANHTTPLMHAARLGLPAIAAELIECGAALNAVNHDGNNALWLACFSDNLELIDLLIRSGVEPNRQNDNGATCLMYAASAGKTEVVARLLAAGADAQLKSLDDFTALDMSANIECLRLLRRAGKQVT